MRNSAQRLKNDISLMATEDFQNRCRFLKHSHFTRNRKMPLHKLILTTLFRKGRSLKIELKDFSAKLKNAEISKVGYPKQRMKLNPMAFLEIARFHANQFYKNTKRVKTYKGHLILACDGSDLNVPSTPENKEKFHEPSKHGHYPRPQAGFSCLFDVLNRQICDCAVSYNKTSERTETISHIKNADIIGCKKVVYLFDRGYPSAEMFLDLIDRKQNFLFRLSSVHFKREQKNMVGDDCIVDIVFDKGRIRAAGKENPTAPFGNK